MGALQQIKAAAQNIYLSVKYEVDMRLEHRGGGFCSFVQCLLWWWKEHPRLVSCDGCGESMWMYGEKPNCAKYCSQQCAYYGEMIPETRAGEDDIPF